ncbi:MAG TPA: cell wall hydrolase [Sphingobium sp.]|uniref:cell wall hydrolase n=1 Tax=Sphingobium sp. TaxID=1912891 RepID=UPI002ED2A9FC
MRSRLLPILTLLAFVTIGLIALALHFGMADDIQGPVSSSQHEARRTFDMTNFAKAPGVDAAQIVEDTASDASTLKPLSVTDAQAANARIAAVSDVGPAASPLVVPLGDGVQYLRALDCMTAAVYYEAANEPMDGQRAVAQVVMNRARHLAYPHTICGVVYQGAERTTGCQFSFTCDGSLARVPSQDGWRRARSVASAALGGIVYAPVGLATHYHADYVLPYWAPTLVKQKTIGRHIFYRWPGAWGTRRSFAAVYERAEPDVYTDKQLAATVRGSDGALPLPHLGGGTVVNANERPILMAAMLPAAVTGAPAKEGKAVATDGLSADNPLRKDGRNYLMSKNASSPPPGPPVRRSVTGGVIMPGTMMHEAMANSAGETGPPGN